MALSVRQYFSSLLSGFLMPRVREILQDAGKVSAEIAKVHAESEFEKYRIVHARLFESDFDRLVQQAGLGASSVSDLV